jgi:uncharacterized membrane protein
MTGSTRTPAPEASTGGGGTEFELVLARMLNLGALMSVLLLAVGVGLMAVEGRSPLDGEQLALDVGRIPSDIVAMRAEGFLWLGLLFVIATPAARVVASLAGFAANRERGMALIALAILGVIASGVALSVANA